MDKKLQWACRRGMLELDVILRNFLDDVYPTLCAEDQASFIELLSQPDPELIDWLLGMSEPSHAFINIVKQIKQHARSRIHS